MQKHKVILVKHIHSCFASMSSRDVWLYKPTDCVPVGTPKDRLTVDTVAKIKEVHVEADETFCKRALAETRRGKGLPDFDQHPDFLALIKQYKKDGWIDEPKWLTKANKARYKREEEARFIKRQKEGYVIPVWHKDLKPVDYQGGFSNEVMQEKVLADYLAGGGCHGYIGHSVRKAKIDIYLEKQFMKLKTPTPMTQIDLRNILAVWLTSTDGRHFGDSLESFSFEKQKQAIKTCLKAIFNTGFIYSRLEHKGTYGSTETLSKKYKDELFQ